MILFRIIEVDDDIDFVIKHLLFIYLLWVRAFGKWHIPSLSLDNCSHAFMNFLKSF